MIIMMQSVSYAWKRVILSQKPPSEHFFQLLNWASPSETSKYFISNYAGACSDVIIDNNNTKELFLWLPGNTRNHSETPNTVSVKTSYGYDIIATKKIKAGTEILADYKTEYGPAPEWFSKWIIENKTTAIFENLNNFMWAIVNWEVFVTYHVSRSAFTE